jgi:hypothetical protein
VKGRSIERESERKKIERKYLHLKGRVQSSGNLPNGKIKRKEQLITQIMTRNYEEILSAEIITGNYQEKL